MSDAVKSNRGRKATLTDSARKRNRQLISSNYNKSRVSLGDQLNRWNTLKNSLGLDTHAEVARVLLDRDSELSGIENLSTRKFKSVKYSSSFRDPFELSIPASGYISDSEGDHSSDEDYEPSFDFSTLIPDCTIEEVEYETDEEEDISDHSQEDFGPGVQRVLCETEIDDFTEDKVFLVYSESLLRLAKTRIDHRCIIKGCGAEVSIKTDIISSAVYLKWICSNDHVIHKWGSQPVLNRRMHGGDLLFASAVLFSGNNFQKISLLAQFLHLPICENATYHKIQRAYLIHWDYLQEDNLEEFRNKDIVVLGDGRMDSPGHCAQYCTYSFIENTTKKILCIITLDKRVTDKKSTNLEKACFIKGMKYLQDNNIRVVKVVTDAHPQIHSVMKKLYPNIKHSYDVWHGAKNLGKRIIKVANKDKENKVLLKWTTDIVNHFWHVCEKSNTYQEFIGGWFGLVHHVVN